MCDIVGYEKVNVEKISCNRNCLKYYGKPLKVKIPPMICYDSIEDYFGKQLLKLKINDVGFYNFIDRLEEHNMKFCNDKAEYRSALSRINGDYYITFKVPYKSRSKQFMLDIKSEKIQMPSVYDIKRNSIVECVIHINKVWNYMKPELEDSECGTFIEICEINIIS